MAIIDDVNRVLSGIPEVKSKQDCMEALDAFLTEPLPIKEFFEREFPRQLIIDVADSCRAENSKLNRVLIKQVWETVISLPTAAVPQNMKRRKLM